MLAGRVRACACRSTCAPRAARAASPALLRVGLTAAWPLLPLARRWQGLRPSAVAPSSPGLALLSRLLCRGGRGAGCRPLCLPDRIGGLQHPLSSLPRPPAARGSASMPAADGPLWTPRAKGWSCLVRASPRASERCCGCLALATYFSQEHNLQSGRCCQLLPPFAKLASSFHRHTRATDCTTPVT